MNSTMPKILVLHTTYYYAQSAPRHLLNSNKQTFDLMKEKSYICTIMSHICHAQKLKEFHMSLIYLDEVCNLYSIGYIKTVLPSNRKHFCQNDNQSHFMVFLGKVAASAPSTVGKVNSYPTNFKV